MKNILVLGATGHIGRLIVKNLSKQSDVKQRLFVRNIEKLSDKEINEIEVMQGDIMDTLSLHNAMKDQDVVIASLNGDLLGQAKSIVKAIKDTKVSRIIWVTGLGIYHEVPGEIGKILEYYVNKFPEYIEAADTISECGVTYTLVRAGNVIDGDNEIYYISKEGEEVQSGDVTKAAVAKFIADMIQDKNGLGENDSLGVTNKKMKGDMMSKKVLVLQGSPRKNGNSDLLSNEFMKGAKNTGCQVEKIYIKDKNVNGCLGCTACQKNGGKCVQKDDMQEIYLKLLEADVIVFSSPVYFYTWNAQMKTVLDRMIAVEANLKNKTFYMISAGQAPEEKYMETMIDSFRKFISCFRGEGNKEGGFVFGYGTDKTGDVDNTPAMKKTYEMGNNIV